MEQDTVTVDDLERIYIRAQDEQGQWGNVTIKDATDAQFQNWAASKMIIEGQGSWPLDERADFCNVLWQLGALHMLPK